MKRLVVTLSAALLMVLIVSIGTALAVSYAIQNVQFPTDPTYTQLLGIDNTGTVVGFHGAVTAQAFTLTLPNLYTNQNFPGSAQSKAAAINGASSVAGSYVDVGGTTHGYVNIGGTFSTVDQPGTAFNRALGINNANTSVGYSTAPDPSGQIGQKAYSQTGGVFTDISILLPPTNQNSQAAGINNAGNIVGFYQPTTTTAIGFLDVGNTISTIDPFGSLFTQALGINNAGEIVGFYTDAGGIQHGYIDLGGVFSSFDPPGSVSTTINGVNNLGQIVGFYTNANQDVIGFVGTPTSVPEPSSFALLLVGVIGISLVRQRRSA
jgi:hypothetical protein